jgi:FixJ family two-component response regulator
MQPSEAAGCVVLDLQISGLGGLALQKLLAQAEDPLPVIFLTAHGDVSSSVRAIARRSGFPHQTGPVGSDN